MQEHSGADTFLSLEKISEAALSADSSLATGNEEILLWQSFKKGNRLAFTTLYQKYVGLLYNYGRHLSADHELVKDCLQELFAFLWNKKETLSEIHSVRHYLYKSFRRRLIAELVKRRKFVSDEGIWANADFEITLPFETQLVETQLGQQQHIQLNEAINRLTKRQKEAIFLKFYNNMSYQEVASVMQMGVDSVYNVVSKAIDALRKNMKRISLLLSLLLTGF
jgi:RNA polymerase sigma factor (sigma-70 family)